MNPLSSIIKKNKDTKKTKIGIYTTIKFDRDGLRSRSTTADRVTRSSDKKGGKQTV